MKLREVGDMELSEAFRVLVWAACFVFIVLACLTTGNDNYGEAAVACGVIGFFL